MLISMGCLQIRTSQDSLLRIYVSIPWQHSLVTQGWPPAVGEVLKWQGRCVMPDVTN